MNEQLSGNREADSKLFDGETLYEMLIDAKQMQNQPRDPLINDPQTAS